MMKNNFLFIRNLGRISYPRFIDIKNCIFESEKQSNETNGGICNLREEDSNKNTLLLVEHSSPLFTFPKKSNYSNEQSSLSESILSSTPLSPSSSKNKSFEESYKNLSKLGFDVCMVEKRQSGIVVHGPGQLTVYPIFSKQYKIDEIQYLKKLENVVQKTLSHLNINSTIKNDQILINNQIIGDIKIFNNQFKLPGFSLNINTNFGGYSETKHLTSISNVLSKSCLISVPDVIPIVSENFKKEFNFEIIDDLYSYYVSQLSNNQTNPIVSQAHLFANQNQSQKNNIPLSF